MNINDQAAVAASYAHLSPPKALARYVKFVWAVLGVVVIVATSVVNNLANVMPAAYLAAVQGIIGALSSLLVLRDSNTLSPATVVSLVSKYLPNHTLVAVADAAVPLVPLVDTYFKDLTGSRPITPEVTPTAPAPVAAPSLVPEPPLSAPVDTLPTPAPVVPPAAPATAAAAPPIA